MPTSRFLVENNGSNQDNIKLALSKAYHLCKDADLQRISLLFPAKGSFSHSDIATFLGAQATKIQLKGQTVDLGNNVRLEFKIPRNFSTYGNHDIVLAIYLTDKDMDIVDSVQNINSIVFLPWSEEEGKRWLSTWDPEVVGPSTWKTVKQQFPPLLVMKFYDWATVSTCQPGLAIPLIRAWQNKFFLT